MTLLGLVTLCGCQTYDFEPVTPITISETSQRETIQFRQLTPNVMLAVDRSGSMGLRVTCTGPGTCPRRLEEVKTAMGGFLTTNPTLARFGLVQYPFGNVGDDECGAPPLVSIGGPGSQGLPSSDDPAVLTNAANAVNTTLQAIDDWGNTPTGAVLTMLQGYTPLHSADRSNFVLLLTDGLPNCNANNVNSCANAAACRCTDDPCTGPTCRLMCLDDNASFAAAVALREQGVRTIVVGFGASVASGDGYSVLNGLALAGGFGRLCDSNPDCDAADSCDVTTHQCRNTHFYKAQNAAELAGALASISGGITGDPCRVQLVTPPSDPLFMSVRLNGQTVLADPVDGWELLSSDQVVFHGQLCAQLSQAPGGSPHDLEISVVNPL